ncbi:hypothetical protein O6H91_02G006200 [Diphasiastrum complanatum]|uniref:Uncharacterized protein n=1 Tax=Diphasiastrum complanatum TaxID=34168 RepID=A0ACC2EC84_DIPCM|nr:hypothetical protein O6H91_02G006200 [Diphasiastrum complanatum]
MRQLQPEERQCRFCEQTLGSLLLEKGHLQMVTSDSTQETEKFRFVVDHPVLFKMPELHADDEKRILDGLYFLKDEFEGVYTLSTGRLIKEVDNCTHAIFVRFPSDKVLVDYYNSPPLLHIASEMGPFNHGEYTVDYSAYVDNNEKSIYRIGKEFYYGVEHLVFLKVKDGVSHEVVEDLIESIYQLAIQMDSMVVQITGGANNYIRNKVFSHAFVAHILSVELLEHFYKHPAYVKLWEEKIDPITSWALSVDYVPYHPSISS